MQLPPLHKCRKGVLLYGFDSVIYAVCLGKYGLLLYLQMAGQEIAAGSQPGA